MCANWKKRSATGWIRIPWGKRELWGRQCECDLWTRAPDEHTIMKSGAIETRSVSQGAGRESRRMALRSVAKTLDLLSGEPPQVAANGLLRTRSRKLESSNSRLRGQVSTVTALHFPATGASLRARCSIRYEVHLFSYH
jgi:hypothetical protein